MVSNQGPTHLLQSPQQEGFDRDDKVQKQELDDLLANAMSQLTFEERQKQHEVLHGVNQNVEDENFLDGVLQDLDHQLSCNKQRSLYEVAKRMDPEYVQARPFRVMFLRANEYDPKASADQMVRFFEMKSGLFGREKLTKDISLDDLDENDLACLQAGCRQLAGRDQSGRQVIVTFGGLLESCSPKSCLRAQYFVQMKAMEDQETQIRGRVSIWYAMGGFRSKANGKGYVDAFRAARAFPQKVAAIHICLDDMHQAVFCNGLIKLMKGNMRARVRVHSGSPMECQYQLSTYGILPQSLPLHADGTMNLDRHLNWVRCCDVKHTISSPLSSSTACENDTANLNPSKPLASPSLETSPNPEDVLFAGVKMNKQQGNQRFRAIVHDLALAYDSATDDTKRQIVSTIIDGIRDSGGRFLKQTRRSKHWEEVPPKELRKKVMQAFRNNRRCRNSSNQKSASEGIFITDVPLPADVVFGRGQRNPGTEMLHVMVNESFERYESLDRGVKIRLVERIMNILMHQGARFLQACDSEPGRWIELSYENARERISKCLQNYRR